MSNFQSLGLSDPIVKALDELGFETPTAIQEEAIPQLTAELRDFIGLAQTGTGKTAAFGLPLLQQLDPDTPNTQALIIAPTRELCQQIAQQMESFAKYMKWVQIVSVYGGAPIQGQIRQLKKPTQIIVATPGRLIDLIGRKAVKIGSITNVVLDEADEMLNMGFKDDIDKILSFTPETKTTWLFSATMPPPIRKIVRDYMVDPLEVKVSTGTQVNENIEHQYVVVKASDKAESLTRFLDADPDMRGIVFCRTRRDTQALAEILMRKGYKAEALHGEMSQAQRDRVMDRFKKHHLQVCVATDVAARGIDVNDLTHVIHYALPDDQAYYTHRSGRTARAGKKGISLAVVTAYEKRKIKWFERDLKVTFTPTTVPGGEEIRKQKIARWTDAVCNIPVPEYLDAATLEQAIATLEAFTKEELIAKLIGRELESLGLSGRDRDLNDVGGRRDREDRGDRKPRDRNDRGDRRDRDRGPRDRKDRFDRGEKKDWKDKKRDRPERPARAERPDRAERVDHSDMETDRFFINLGSMDKISKRDLMEFVLEVGKLKRGQLGSVTLDKKSSYFEVEKGAAKNVAARFNGLIVDGRPLRVNLDGTPMHGDGGKSKKKDK